MLILFAPAGSQQIAVTSCGADPTGHKDSTSAFQKCLSTLPAGNLFIPYGTYRITAPVFKKRNQNLVGMGSRASVLKCEAVNGPCIVAADTTGGPANYSTSVIQDLGIEGPGTNNHSAGILLGGDPADKVVSKDAFGDAVNIVDVRVRAFNHGVEWGNNAHSNKVVQSYIVENSSGLFTLPNLANSGKAISITDSSISNNQQYGIEDHNSFEWMIQGSSFDYNNTAIMFYGATIHAMNCHFEQGRAPIFLQPSGHANLSIKDSEIRIQSNTGTDKYVLSTWPQSLNLAIDDVNILSNHPVQYFMRVQGKITGVITNLHGNENKKIGALSEAHSQAAVTALDAF